MTVVVDRCYNLCIVCVIEGCGREKEGEKYGLCKSHAQKFRKTMDMADLHCTACAKPLPFATRLSFHKDCVQCQHEGCWDTYFQRGYCKRHYMRFYRGGADYSSPPRCENCGSHTGSEAKNKRFCDECNRQRFLEQRKRYQAERRAGKVTGDKFTVKQLLDLDGSLCYLCQSELGRDVTYEHVVPLSRGGTNHLYNVALAHRSCNNKKRARLLEEIGEDFPLMELPERIVIVCPGY